jgi:hypothetical protein
MAPFNPPKCWHSLAAAILLALVCSAKGQAPTTQQAPAKTLIDYFLPAPIVGKLSSDAWGAPNVLPRDQDNGLEDQTIKQFNYWDGQIIKGPDGKYHMFASRWDQSRGHNGWPGSVAVHAVSDSPIGPYIDKGICWPDSMNGRGHNVTALVLPNNQGFAVIVSETRPGAVFVSESLDGPWKMKGLLTVAGQPNWRASNVSVMVRPDGDFMIVPRNGRVMISKASDGVCGPYTIVGPAFPRGIPNLEDPVVWYSGGLYHIVVNSWSTRTAYHLTSKDGKTHWVNRGIAYDPRKDFVRYTDGTVNHWNKMERPGVYLENGHVKCFTFASIDVEKNQDRGNDNHGSKVVVVPFDGEAFDRDMEKIVAAEDAAAAADAIAPK